MIEISEELLKYWIEGVHEELLDAPSNNLILIYESMINTHTKLWGVKKK